MKTVQISTTTKERAEAGHEPIIVNFQLPETIEEAVEAWGGEVVLAKSNQQGVINLQAAVRNRMKPNKDGVVATDEQIIEDMDGWVPTVQAAGKTKVQKAADALSSLSAEERQAVLDELKAQLAG